MELIGEYDEIEILQAIERAFAGERIGLILRAKLAEQHAKNRIVPQFVVVEQVCIIVHGHPDDAWSGRKSNSVFDAINLGDVHSAAKPKPCGGPLRRLAPISHTL
jgi:hypothetical protein